MRRVLRRGILAIYDVVAGTTALRSSPCLGRVPEPASSDARGMREALARAGFSEVSWSTRRMLSGVGGRVTGKRQRASATRLHIVMGPQFAEMAAISRANLQEAESACSGDHGTGIKCF